MSKDLLAIYLKDHVAGALAGLKLAERAANNNEGGEYGRELAEICREIAEDRRALSELMDRLEIRPSASKQAAAWIGERLGRFKLNGRLTGYSPLSRLVELEGLVIGVSGNLELWRSLRAMRGSEQSLAGVDLKRMIERTESQRTRLENLHDLAAREALAA